MAVTGEQPELSSREPRNVLPQFQVQPRITARVRSEPPLRYDGQVNVEHGRIAVPKLVGVVNGLDGVAVDDERDVLQQLGALRYTGGIETKLQTRPINDGAVGLNPQELFVVERGHDVGTTGDSVKGFPGV